MRTIVVTPIAMVLLRFVLETPIPSFNSSAFVSKAAEMVGVD